MFKILKYLFQVSFFARCRKLYFCVLFFSEGQLQGEFFVEDDFLLWVAVLQCGCSLYIYIYERGKEGLVFSSVDTLS